jgi:hypothetical protein
MRFPRVPVVLSVALLSCLCLLVHELAHAFAALCCGGNIREFVLVSLTPHVRVTGPFTLAQHTWICAAGSAAEVLLFLLALWIAPRTRGGRLAIEVTGLFAAIELLGWGLSAVAYPYGPRNTDVWKFLSSSGLHPWSVLGTCVVAATVFFVAYRTRLRSHS